MTLIRLVARKGDEYLIINELQRAFAQILALSFIPFTWWALWREGTKKSKCSFFEWIGLKKPIITQKIRFIIIVIIALIVSAAMSLLLDPVLPDDIQLANERFAGQGMRAFVPALIFSLFATALPEEVFFRGFLGKHLIIKFGFGVGNTIQAVIFGFLHGAIMFPALGMAIPILVIGFTGTLGWLMGYINEKAEGSIFPSWFIHAISNIYACVIIMYELL